MTSDYTGFSGAASSPLTITLTDLNTALSYNIWGVTMTDAFTGRQDTLTVVGDVSYGSSTLLRSTSVAGSFHTFTGVNPSGSGTITITLTDASGNNKPIINGLLIEAVPEPGAGLLLLTALVCGLLVRRRK